jgi:hypothetical protein
VVLRAYALAQVALEAESDDAAVAKTRGDLAVLSREDFERVAARVGGFGDVADPAGCGTHEAAGSAQQVQLEIKWAGSVMRRSAPGDHQDCPIGSAPGECRAGGPTSELP